MNENQTAPEANINELKTDLLPSTKDSSQKPSDPPVSQLHSQDKRPPPLRSEEPSPSVSGLGDEVVIFASSIEDSPEARAVRSFIDQALLHSAFLAAALIFISLSALRMYAISTPDVSLVFLSLAAYFTMLLGQAAYSLWQTNRHQRDFKRLMISAGSSALFVLSYTALFLFFAGLIPGKALLFMVLPNALGQIARYTFYNHLEDAVFTLPFFCLSESTTHVMVAIKLLEPEGGPAVWGFVLVWYHVVYYFSWSFIVLLVAAGLIYASFYIFQPEMFEGVDRFKMKFVPFCGLLTALFLVAVCLLFVGFQQLMDLQLVAPSPKRAKELPGFLKGAAIYALGFGLAALALVAAAALFYREALVRRFFKVEGKVVSLKSYIRNLRLKIRRVSGNYFVKSSKQIQEKNEQKSFAADEPQEMDQCTVCYEKPSSVLLDPCKHCIFCEECVKDYLKTQDKCPLCRRHIEKGFVIALDEERKCYVASKSIKIKIEGEDELEMD